jgi:hypothetical protein
LGGLFVPDFDTILQAQLRLLVYVAQSAARGQDLDPFINQAIRAIKAAIDAKLPTGMAEMDGEAMFGSAEQSGYSHAIAHTRRNLGLIGAE